LRWTNRREHAPRTLRELQRVGPGTYKRSDRRRATPSAATAACGGSVRLLPQIPDDAIQPRHARRGQLIDRASTLVAYGQNDLRSGGCRVAQDIAHQRTKRRILPGK